MYLKSYKELEVWKKSILLVKEVYDLSNKLPKSEIYGLVSQIRRSAVSVPSNIAEGYKRHGLGEYLQFLSVADASAAELETQIILIKSIYPEVDVLKAGNLLTEIQKMLFVLIKKLKNKR
ncbi:MAG: four helix bundle protein [Patescibacteria group bacterium]